MISLVAQTVKNLSQCRTSRFDPWVGKMPCRRDWQPTKVFLPGKSQGQRSLVDYSPRGHKETDPTEATDHRDRDRNTDVDIDI